MVSIKEYVIVALVVVIMAIATMRLIGNANVAYSSVNSEERSK